MTRKLLLFLGVLLLVASAAVAQQVDDRAFFLTPDGRLHTIEGEWAAQHPDVATAATRYLVLTTRDGEKVQREIIPGTTTSGVHTNPALAYDNDSKTLFIFWKHSTTLRESNLVFASVSEKGKWSETAQFATSNNYWRTNFRVAITRKTESKDDQGNTILIPEINIHAVWWEDRAFEELARYAMLTIEDGAVASIDLRDLSQYVEKTDEKVQSEADEVEETFNHDILRHPAIFELPSRDMVEVLFGDTTKNRFHRVKLRPIVDGRIRIPLGVKDEPVTAPKFKTETAVSGRVDALAGSAGRFVLYFGAEKSLSYFLYDGSQWADLRSIALDDTVTRATAVDAIRRMLDAE